MVGRVDVEAAFEAAGYRIEAVIGRGGVGTVYRAVQLSLQRDVALKLLTAQQSADTKIFGSSSDIAYVRAQTAPAMMPTVRHTQPTTIAR